jgi:hypothetical protein
MSAKKDPEDVRNVRVHFLISRRMKREIEELATITESVSTSAAIRRAVAFYGKVLAALSDGGTVVIRMKDGKEKEVLVT